MAARKRLGRNRALDSGLSPDAVEIAFGREVCGSLHAAEAREWLVTNGIGGFASGTVAGSSTRRYHGLLIAALQPPVGRVQLVAALDSIARYAGKEYALATHSWTGGAVSPRGFELLESFRLEGTTPVWRFALADGLLEQRVWMCHGENTTYVQFTLLRGSGPLEFESRALVNYRDFHSSTHAGDWRMRIEPVENGVRVSAFDAAVPFYLRAAGSVCEPRHEWYRNCFWPVENFRGLDDHEDHLFVALFRSRLEAGASITFVFSTEADAALDAIASRAESNAHKAELLAAWTPRDPATASAPGWVRQLVLAADQFIVKRSLPEEIDGRSIIAGYHWFADWGRDTMIALPGLTLATGRAHIARKILFAFARLVDGGMLPNNFPDAGGRPQYNTVDAALWYFEAVRQYYAATQDAESLAKLYPMLLTMIDAHVKGTRYQIHADPADGLLYAGEPGVQLTWMDAKVGEWVVTPRIGKPVEVNALWINALETMAEFSGVLGKPADALKTAAVKAKAGFARFWNAQTGCCFDVVDSPGIGDDASLRPNQILAVALPISPLRVEQQKAVVDTCARELLTAHGLRSLAPGDPRYIGHYRGGPRERDAAYHQGTVWGWLLGPFALAHYRVYRDRAAALQFLEPLGRHVQSYGLGTLGEIFDGDAPHAPGGCISQAWTVGEVLRAWDSLHLGRPAAQGSRKSLRS
jgi:predicted glycogen debranching enzyme